MNRYTFEKAVYESNLDAPSKQVLAYYAFRKHWNGDGNVWPSAATIANDTSLSVRTVENRIPKLRDAGWIIDTGQLVHNGKGRPSRVYDLAIGEDFTAGDAAKYPDTFTATVAGKGDLYRTKVGTLPQEMRTFTARDADEQVIQQVIEEEETTTTGPDGPVVDTTSLNLEKEVPPAKPVTPTLPLTPETGKVRAYKPKAVKEPSKNELEEFETVHPKLTKQEREELEKERLEPAW